jgi:hypothetical protein
VLENAKCAKLAEVKLALARKYENLAKLSHSKPKRKTLLLHVDRFRRQARDLQLKAVPRD